VNAQKHLQFTDRGGRGAARCPRHLPGTYQPAGGVDPNQVNFIKYNSFIASVQTYLERVFTKNGKPPDGDGDAARLAFHY